MGKKYIVELDDNKLAYTAIIIDGVPYIKPLQLLPYTEPNASEAYQRGYDDAKHECTDCQKIMTDAEQERVDKAYQQGHKDGYNKHDTEKIRKQGYDKGLDDLGNALRLLLFQYSNYTLQNIFGYDTARAVVEHFEGSEIVARIRCYEGGVKQDAETIRKEAYQRGYDDAKHECQDCQKIMMDAEQERVDKAYQQGLNDAENRKATCEFCGYVNKGELDEPCKFCANNYINMFRPRKDNKLVCKSIRDIMDSLDCTISDFEKAIEEIKNEAD